MKTPALFATTGWFIRIAQGLAGALFILSLHAAVVHAGEFSVDESTLFLAHFNQGIDADHAKGDKTATGSAEIDPKGLMGGALRAMWKPNQPRFCPLGYAVKDNLNRRQGTFEMWVKTVFDAGQNTKNEAGFAFYFYLSIQQEETRKLLLYVREHEYQRETRMLHFFPFTAAPDRKDAYALASAGDVMGADQWAHLAITWDEKAIQLYVNGKKASLLKPLLPEDGKLYAQSDPATDKLYLGGLVLVDGKPACNTSCANALIDEVRISDIVRYNSGFGVDPATGEIQH